MAPRFVRTLAGFAPSGTRRAIAGAIVDLKSLPARLTDPARRNEPWSWVHNVGNGDFQAIGVMLLAKPHQKADLARIIRSALTGNRDQKLRDAALQG